MIVQLTEHTYVLAIYMLSHITLLTHFHLTEEVVET